MKNPIAQCSLGSSAPCVSYIGLVWMFYADGDLIFPPLRWTPRRRRSFHSRQCHPTPWDTTDEGEISVDLHLRKSSDWCLSVVPSAMNATVLFCTWACRLTFSSRQATKTFQSTRWGLQRVCLPGQSMTEVAIVRCVHCVIADRVWGSPHQSCAGIVIEIESHSALSFLYSSPERHLFACGVDRDAERELQGGS